MSRVGRLLSDLSSQLAETRQELVNSIVTVGIVDSLTARLAACESTLRALPMGQVPELATLAERATDLVNVSSAFPAVQATVDEISSRVDALLASSNVATVGDLVAAVNELRATLASVQETAELAEEGADLEALSQVVVAMQLSLATVTEQLPMLQEIGALRAQVGVLSGMLAAEGEVLGRLVALEQASAELRADFRSLAEASSQSSAVGRFLTFSPKTLQIVASRGLPGATVVKLLAGMYRVDLGAAGYTNLLGRPVACSVFLSEGYDGAHCYGALRGDLATNTSLVIVANYGGGYHELVNVYDVVTLIMLEEPVL